METWATTHSLMKPKEEYPEQYIMHHMYIYIYKILHDIYNIYIYTLHEEEDTYTHIFFCFTEKIT